MGFSSVYSGLSQRLFFIKNGGATLCLPGLIFNQARDKQYNYIDNETERSEAAKRVI
jgi:hypothetical protein